MEGRREAATARRRWRLRRLRVTEPWNAASCQKALIIIEEGGPKEYTVSMSERFRICKIFLIGILIGLISSCSSVPKTIKNGDTLIIGRITIGQNDSEYLLVIKEVKSGKAKAVKTDSKGYFLIRGLKAGETYSYVEVKEGGGSWIKVPLNMKRFVPFENSVVNLGWMDFSFGGSSYGSWRFKDYAEVRNFFFRMADQRDSEWFDADIHNQ